MRRFQSILMPVAEAEPLVEPFRRSGDWSSAFGIPAHVTIAGPWPLPVSLPLPAISDLGAANRGTPYTLATVGTLGDAVCLFPEEDSVLERLRRDLLATVGVADDLDEDWRIHLTVSRGSPAESAAAAIAAIERALPLRCEAQPLLLAQMHGDSEVSVRPL